MYNPMDVIIPGIYSHSFNHLSLGLRDAVAIALEGRPNLTPLNVAEGHSGVGLDLADVGGSALVSIARTGVATVQPLHVAALVPPDTHGQDHATGHGSTHAGGSTEVHVALRADGLTVLIVGVVDLGGVVKLDGGILNDLAVLDVKAVVLLEDATVIGGELGDNGDGLGGVDLLAETVELVVADVVGVVAAAVLVADTVELALSTLALVELGLVARVRS
jgi:hypothetical protein